MLPHDKRPLRERKKARTRAAIQRHALQLFREQGYEATTVSQIAEAAEVSESTFFRYFPDKEAVVRWDDFDPLILEVFRAQPAGSSPIQALRAAMRSVLAQLSPEAQSELRERLALAVSIAPLGATLLDQVGRPMRLFVEAVAERAGRSPDDVAVRIFVAAVMGVGMSVLFAAAEKPDADVVLLLDEALALLEAGLPL